MAYISLSSSAYGFYRGYTGDGFPFDAKFCPLSLDITPVLHDNFGTFHTTKGRNTDIKEL